MTSTSRRRIFAAALLAIATLGGTAHADPIDDANTAVNFALQTISTNAATIDPKCVGVQYTDVPYLSYRVDDLSNPGTIYFVWDNSITASVNSIQCARGVKAAIRIRDYAGIGAVASQFIHDSFWCRSENATGFSTTVNCSLQVPYYGLAEARNTAWVTVDVAAWNKDKAGTYFRYACDTYVYQVLATPAGPRYVADRQKSPGSCVDA